MVSKGRLALAACLLISAAVSLKNVDWSNGFYTRMGFGNSCKKGVCNPRESLDTTLGVQGEVILASTTNKNDDAEGLLIDLQSLQIAQVNYQSTLDRFKRNEVFLKDYNLHGKFKELELGADGLYEKGTSGKYTVQKSLNMVLRADIHFEQAIGFQHKLMDAVKDKKKGHYFEAPSKPKPKKELFL